MFKLLDFFIPAYKYDIQYTMVVGKHCYPNKYRNYGTIQSAKEACSADGNCQGVYDNGCYNNNFHLCQTSATYMNSSRSCIFQKNESGKYFISLDLDNTLFWKYRLKS